MAHTTNMIYDEAAITDLQAVLPTSETRIAQACANTSGNINKWARWKSLIWPFQFLPRIDMWRGPDGRCGLTIKTYTGVGNINTPGSFLYDITHNLCEWVYNAPQGDESQPCRSGDFTQWLGEGVKTYLGYINNAVRPFGGNDVEVLPTETVTIPFEVADMADSDGGIGPNLMLTDFTFNGVSAAEYYPGVVLHGPKGTYFFTGENKLGSGNDLQVTASNLALSPGEYTCWPYLSSYKRGPMDVEQVGTLIPLDNFSIKVTVRENGYFYSVVFGGWNAGYRSIWGVLNLINDSWGSKTVSNPKVYLYRVQAGRDPGQYGELVQTITVRTGNITIPARDSLNLDFSASGLTKGNYDWYLSGPSDIFTNSSYWPLEDPDDPEGGGDEAP